MHAKYRLFSRKGTFYSEDRTTGHQTSLRTTCKTEAQQLLAAKNQAAVQPTLNLSMARAYLTHSSPEMMTRTWLDVMKEIEAGYTKEGPSWKRWQKFMRSEPLKDLRNMPLLLTENTHLLAVMRDETAGVSTNKFLRMCHNRALDMGWILAPVLSKKMWPKFVYKERRAITADEHQRIMDAEQLEDYRLYYDLLWNTGGSQSDIASLTEKSVNWVKRRLTFGRRKLRGKGLVPVLMAIGPNLQTILAKLPEKGEFFPRLSGLGENVRASHFTKLCRRAGVEGVSLHCYRYSWAERAENAGMPEREAMAHLGHNSAAIHRYYSKNAHNVTLPLEHYEALRLANVIAMEKGHAVSEETHTSEKYRSQSPGA
jgi:integrase